MSHAINSSNKPTTVTLKLSQSAKLKVDGYLIKWHATISLKQVMRLIEHLGLDANPRNSKINQVTTDIEASLRIHPKLFPAMSKGIVLAASRWQQRDRDRIELTFENPLFEGVADGGHNLLGIGCYILRRATENKVDRELKSGLVWAEFKSVLNKYQNEVHAYLDDLANAPELSEEVPLEILVPEDTSDETLRRFYQDIQVVQPARNFNTPMPQQAWVQQEGFFKPLQENLPLEISKRVQWKPNELAREVSVTDVVALSWIPLTKLGLKVKDEDGQVVSPPSPTATYSSKGACLAVYHRFMSSPEVTSTENPRELIHEGVKSAMEIMQKLPDVYDRIYAEFPELYNKSTGGKFGALRSVEAMNSKGGAKGKTTRFRGKPVTRRYPEGLIAPLVYGVQSLMVVNDQGLLRWEVQDLDKFLDQNLESIVGRYSGIITENSSDPQKVGKSTLAYEHALTLFDNALYRFKS